MKRLLNILVIDSIRELIRYKSFFLLVALLILLDRLLRHYSAKIQFQFDRGSLLDYQWLAVWTYETLPGEMMGMLLNWKLWAVAMGLLLKDGRVKVMRGDGSYKFVFEYMIMPSFRGRPASMASSALRA